MEHIAWLELRELNALPPLQEGGVCVEVELIQDSFRRMKAGVLSFSKYVPTQVVRGLLRMGAGARLGVSRRMISIYFSDIAGFTSICEGMAPSELLVVLSEYFQAMSEIIGTSGGVLAEFIGDAILGLWNCPDDVPAHAFACVDAAVKMQEALAAMRPGWRKRGFPRVAIREGVHTDAVYCGNIGSAERMK